MQADLECQGKVVLGRLPEELAKRLSRFSGNWLEFDALENAIVVRHVQPTGCPALSGIPCELISILDLLPGGIRDAIPGGELFIISRETEQLVRLRVERGAVRIQWAHPDYSASQPIALQKAMEDFNPRSGRVNGHARFAGKCDLPAGERYPWLRRSAGFYRRCPFLPGPVAWLCRHGSRMRIRL